MAAQQRRGDLELGRHVVVEGQRHGNPPTSAAFTDGGRQLGGVHDPVAATQVPELRGELVRAERRHDFAAGQMGALDQAVVDECHPHAPPRAAGGEPERPGERRAQTGIEATNRNCAILSRCLERWRRPSSFLTRDRREVVLATVRGVLAQRDVALEVVVVDDGSRDGTSEALASLGSPAVRIVRHAESLGLARARNAGLWAATSPWIALLDDDDRWAPDKLRSQLAAAETAGRRLRLLRGGHGGARWGRAGAAATHPSLRLCAARSARATRSRPAPPTSSCGRTWSAASVASTRRSAHLADWDLWIRLTEAGDARPLRRRPRRLSAARVQHASPAGRRGRA